MAQIARRDDIVLAEMKPASASFHPTVAPVRSPKGWREAFARFMEPAA